MCADCNVCSYSIRQQVMWLSAVACGNRYAKTATEVCVGTSFNRTEPDDHDSCFDFSPAEHFLQSRWNDGGILECSTFSNHEQFLISRMDMEWNEPNGHWWRLNNINRVGSSSRISFLNDSPNNCSYFWPISHSINKNTTNCFKHRVVATALMMTIP